MGTLQIKKNPKKYDAVIGAEVEKLISSMDKIATEIETVESGSLSPSQQA